MNRHDRRAEAARVRKIVDKVYWKQRVDPTDSGYALIEMRLPIPNAADYPEVTYTGGAALDRARRFAQGYLAGYADGRAERDEES